jgi:hypothetical protein
MILGLEKKGWIFIDGKEWDIYYHIERQDMPDKMFATVNFAKRNNSYIQRSELLELQDILDINLEEIETDLILMYNERPRD